MKTPLAWLNLWHEKIRLGVAIAGVAFADILVFTNLGFLGSVAESASFMYQKINADLYLTSPRSIDLSSSQPFPRQRIYQVAGVEGVERVMPLYMGYLLWRNPETHLSRGILVYGLNPHDPVLPIPGVVEHQAELQKPWTVLLDERGKDEIGPKQAGVVTELSEQHVRVIGTFQIGTDFASENGNLIMSDQNFLRYFANLAPGKDSRALHTVDIGLVKVAPGTDVSALTQAMRQQLPTDVAVWTKAEFLAKEREYWRSSTSIGFIFSLLAGMSFIVGIILVYQILYTDVAEHGAEYATLKAMGYSNSFLFGTVLQESLILAVIGFLPGLGMSVVLYHITANATGLVMLMTVMRALSILIATFSMCLISGTIALRRIQAADPAEVFG